MMIGPDDKIMIFGTQVQVMAPADAFLFFSKFSGLLGWVKG